jgi:aspartokinase-like uncharacterized kinase
VKRRVIKFGGSLLPRKDVGPKLKFWLYLNPDMQNIIVVGGGELADSIRSMNRLFNDEEAHEFACRAMSLNAKVLGCYLKESDFCSDIEQVNNATQPTVIFDSVQWILECPEVPKSWDFTSDSIAAKLATELDADELVLIKSRMGELDEPGFVDPCFAEESKSVKSIRVSTLDE